MVNYLEMVDYKLFSADSHVSEPPDLWLERIGQEYEYRAPRVESRMKDGRVQEFLIYEGFPPHPVSVGLASAAREGNNADFRRLKFTHNGAHVLNGVPGTRKLKCEVFSPLPLGIAESHCIRLPCSSARPLEAMMR
jgi:hypothetical protein